MKKGIQAEELKNTSEIVYRNCAERIRLRIEEKKIKHKDIHKDDPKIISRIINYKINNKKNPYLIQFAVLCNIRENLDFKNNQEILWGTPKEIIEYDLPLMFQNIIRDILSSSSDIRNEVRDILCGYIPYARHSSLYQLLSETESPMIEFELSSLYNIDEVFVDAKTDEAITYIYSLCEDKFKEKYLEFTDSLDSFSRWTIKMAEWIEDEFMKILRIYAPTSNSLGMRIRDLIYSDFHYIPDIILSGSEIDPNIVSMKNLVNATNNYIEELENIQRSCTDKNMFW